MRGFLEGTQQARLVANLTRADGLAFLDLAAAVPLKIATEALPLAQANVALARLKQGRLEGAAVLTIADRQ